MENATFTHARPTVARTDPQAAPAFDRRGVCHNTHPRLNQEIDRGDYDRSLEAFARVLGS